MNKKHKAWLAFCSLFLSSFFILSVGCFKTTTEANPGIYVSVKNWFLPHTGKQVEITIKGRTFGQISGEPPYFVRIPRQETIFFVSSDEHYKKKFHIVNLDSGKDIEIEAEAGTLFWGAYDLDSQNERAGHDYVMSDSGTQITLVHAGDPKEVTVIDVLSRKIKSRSIQLRREK